MQTSKAFGHGVVFSKIRYNAVIVLSVVLQVGLSCPCVQNVTHCKRRFVGHVSFQESIPAIPFGNLNHPLPARSRFLRAAVRSTCFAWLHHAHPFVAATGNHTCFMQTSKAFGHAVVVSKIWYKLQYCDCALSCAMRLLQTNEHLSRLSF